MISTGKSDWAHDITEDSGSLGRFLNDVTSNNASAKKKGRKASTSSSTSPTGVFAADDASRISILNGSHRSFADVPSQQSVIVLPDFVVVSNVEASVEGATALWEYALSHDVSVRAGTANGVSNEAGLQTWTLPYNCLIMLCKSLDCSAIS